MAGLNLAGERRPNFESGLLPVIVQSTNGGTVLMLAWVNEAALEATLGTGEAHFWSRSHDALWRKGETSGNVLHVESVSVDCDGDALLYQVRESGPACHTGHRSCFDEAPVEGRLSLAELERIIGGRVGMSVDQSYTARLLAHGPRKPAAKVVEEAGEVAVAALDESSDRLTDEAADLLYHLLVLLHAREVPLADVEARLAERHRQ